MEKLFLQVFNMSYIGGIVILFVLIIRIPRFLTLCMHWFNPLVWIAFYISDKDMEMSCDETAIRRLGNGIKKDYSKSLLLLATGCK